MNNFKVLSVIIVFIMALSATARAAQIDKDLEKRVINKTRELIATYSGPAKSNLAVVNSTNNAISQAIEGIVVRTVFLSGRFIIVERDSLKPILEELKLQNAGMTNVAIAQQIGKFTPAQSVLFISIESDSVDLRIVSVEKGEMLSYVYFSISDDMVTPVRKKQEPVIDRKNYHSPVLAGLVSVFPIYSGSWNAQFTEFGMFLVVLKSLSPLPVAYFAYDLDRRKRIVANKTDQVNRFLVNTYYASGPAIVNQYAQLGQLAIMDKKTRVPHARKLYKRWGRYCSYIWAGSTVIDIISSAFYMVWWNNRYAYIYSTNGKNPGDITYNVTLRETQGIDGQDLRNYIEGLNIKVSCRF